ncbi:PREDICTED: formin-like protein 8 [Fragaria vesca subsp. vesca]|uniref:formin-like protein 8 n=1 Tax=Fragaria vesca subsp. vesca TaxID=101020 RepID=UPI0002C2F9E7|nr:PREDICTED: formin-like protein 8 [Fragaria vesca subsp. vesca]XP_011463404.1 PREDICTED: formin-like protein 8 [Fragaria vesca subsp. vesca]
MAGALHLILNRPWLPLLLLFCIFRFCYAQPQNIETFFPFPPVPSLAPAPSPAPISPYFPPVESPPPEPQPPLPLPLPNKKSNDNRNIAKAAAATAASTLVLCGVVFFFVQRCIVAKRRRNKIGGGAVIGGGGAYNNTSSSRRGQPAAVVNRNEFERYDGNLKGFIVDEDGLDVLYWRKLEAKNSKKKSFKKEAMRNRDAGEEEIDEDHSGEGTSRENELPLFRGRSSTSNMDLVPEGNEQIRMGSSRMMAPKAVENREQVAELTFQSSGSPPPPHSPPPTPPPLPMKVPAVPLPPPPPPVKRPGLPPAPPPKPKSRSLNAMAKPEPKGVKLKPLHWDKVNTNHEHSMVWDKIDNGSFRFDGDLMEALFGTVATNRKSPERVTGSSSSQVCILDERKSQNFAIVIKSLTISIEDILDVLNEGRGLGAENLEKLARIAPTEEEIAKILEYNEDPARLADAESFLYHILKAVPSAFIRLNAMHFRQHYEQEIVQLKESLQTIELGCKELRTRGLFMKLLEAILKAGNRMNAGTSRGNAQAFKLSSLRKLSDVRSSDGKTTLLHFVVEEVVRSEGKRGVLNRNHSLNRSGSQRSSNSNMSSEQNVKSKEDREKEYMMLGLPVVGGISSEFSNVKKAATIDYDSFAITCSALTKRVVETRELILQCEKDGGGRFVFEMNDFLEEAEEELKEMTKEQNRVMEFLKATTEYYQGGASKEKGSHPFQLFVVVKDFLGMVDQACVEISRNVQRRKAVTASLETSSSPDSPPSRNPVRFPVLPKNFMSGSSRSNSSGSDNDV